MLHKNINVGNNHIPYNWLFTNQTNRENSTGYIATDIGKLSLQSDNSSVWILVTTTPTWKEISGNKIYTGITAPDNLLGITGDVYIDTLAVVLYTEKPSDVAWDIGIPLIPESLRTYKHTQSVSNTTWTINHNLNKNPSITLYTIGSVEFSGDITHTSLNQSIVTLTTSIAGFAICN